jgi:hypothetical protein
MEEKKVRLFNEISSQREQYEASSSILIPLGNRSPQLSSNAETTSTTKMMNLYDNSSDAYFAKYTIPEMRIVYSKLQQELETQKIELRTRIGSRYGDIIEASDDLHKMFSISETLVHLWEKSMKKLHQLSLASSSKTLIHTRWQDAKFLETANMKRHIGIWMYQLQALRSLIEKIYRWIAIDHRYMDSSFLFLWLLAIKDQLEHEETMISRTSLFPLGIELRKCLKSIWQDHITKIWFPTISCVLEETLVENGKSLDDLVQVAACYMILKPEVCADHLLSRILELKLKKVLHIFSSSNIDTINYRSTMDVLTEFSRDLLRIVNESYNVVVKRLLNISLEWSSRWNDRLWVQERLEKHVDRYILHLMDMKKAKNLSDNNDKNNPMELSWQSSKFEAKRWDILPSTLKTVLYQWIQEAQKLTCQHIVLYLKKSGLNIKQVSQLRTDFLNLLNKDYHREWITMLQKWLGGGDDHMLSLWSIFFENPFRQHAESLIEEYSQTNEKLCKLFTEIMPYPITEIQMELLSSAATYEKPHLMEDIVHSLESHATATYMVTRQLQGYLMPSSFIQQPEQRNEEYEKIYWNFSRKRETEVAETSYKDTFTDKFVTEMSQWIIKLIQLLQHKRSSYEHEVTESTTAICLWNIRLVAKLLSQSTMMSYIIHHGNGNCYGDVGMVTNHHIIKDEQTTKEDTESSLFTMLERVYIEWLTDYLKLNLYSRVLSYEEEGFRNLYPVSKTTTTIVNVDRYESIEMSEFLKSKLDEIICWLRSNLGETPFIRKTQECVVWHTVMALCLFYESALSKLSTEYVNAIIYHDLCLLNEMFPCSKLESLIYENATRVSYLHI